MTLGLIWAEDTNRAIGLNGSIPWNLPEDLAHFREVTLGHAVVMGRRTWDSLPPWARPLTGRRNIVITRQSDWKADGAEAAHTVEDALEMAGRGDDVWVIGGAQILEQTIGRADLLEITQIRGRYDGDTVAPPRDGWRPITASYEWRTSHSGIEYRFTTWGRR